MSFESSATRTYFQYIYAMSVTGPGILGPSFQGLWGLFTKASAHSSAWWCEKYPTPLSKCKNAFIGFTELQISFWVNWVFTQPDYSQLRIFIFYPTFLCLQIMSAMFFLLNVAIGNSPAYIYSLTQFAFLEHQTSGFYHTFEANLVPLLIFIARRHIASFR